MKFFKPLYIQVLIAVAIGIAVGHYFPNTAVAMKPFGDGFVKLLKMMIAPIIFATVVTGIAKMGDIKTVGRVGLKALIYFEVVTTIALMIGLIVGAIIKPGAGMNVDARTLDVSTIANYTKAAQSQGFIEFILRNIPETIVGAFVTGDILPVIFLGVLFGVTLTHIGGEKGRLVVGVIDGVLDTLFGMVGYLMKLAPLGAFGAMAFTIGKYGIGSLTSLLQLMLTFYITCLVFIFVVLGFITRMCGVPFLKLLAYLKEELLITLGTSSAEPALPRLLVKLEKLGCEKATVGLVLPTGYAFNLDGVCIYLTMGVVFIAHATNTSLTLWQQFEILGVGMLTTKGMAGVPGAGFIALAATLSSVSTLPVAGMALLIGIDRFMAEARSVTSMIGNAVATIVIAKWEGVFDAEKMQRTLANPSAVEEQLDEGPAPEPPVPAKA